MFKSIKIKIIILCLSIALIPFISVAVLSFHTAEDSLESATFNHLSSVRDAKKLAVEDYFATIQSQITVVAQIPSTIAAMQSFSQAFSMVEPIETSVSIQDYWQNKFAREYQTQTQKKFNTDSYFSQLSPKAIHFQSLYIAQNPNPLGSKNNLTQIGNQTHYDKIHGQYHSWFDHY